MTVRALTEEVGLPRHEVERLLKVVTGRERTELVLNAVLDHEQQRRFDDLVARRRAGEPLQYLEGTVPFGPIEVAVDSRVLVPRPETEYLWELAVEAVASPQVIVDLCTGSGNLALALKHRFPDARVLATDRSADALDVAEENARRLRLDVEFLTGDLLEPLPRRLRGEVDLVVANPPYVAESEFDDLGREVRDYEPREALVAGPNGDEVLGRLAAAVADWLRSGGWLFCEIAETQRERALRLFEAMEARVEADLAGKPRYVIGRRP